MGSEDPGFARLFNSIPKYVAPRGTPDLPWAGSTQLGPDLVAAVREIRDRHEHVTVVGSLNLVQTLLREKLFDRLDLWVHLIVLGVAKKVFDGGAGPTNVTLLEPPVGSPKGTVYLRYALAGSTPGTGDMSAPIAVSGATTEEHRDRRRCRRMVRGAGGRVRRRGGAMTSIAHQSEAQLGGRISVLARQRRDHEELDRLLTRLRATSDAEQDEVLTRIARLVFPHAFAEEAVLWPAVRATLPDGEAITLRIEQEHQEVNELWAALERTPHGDPRRAELLDRLDRVLQEDVRDEEDVLLPRLQAALDPARLRRLGVAWEVVRRTAPTRPHPVVARRPPGNALAALPLTVLDRSRDHLDRWGRGRGGAASRAASQLLARVAGAVEHIPPLTRGERPSTHSGRTEVERGGDPG